MKKISFALAILSLFILAACAQQQPEAPIGGGTPVQAVPAPGVDPDTVEEMIVVEEPSSEPSITVDEQAVSNDGITVDRLFLDNPGYVVVHKVVDSKPGTVIGNSALLDGENINVKVTISDYESETELIAMLHYDDGDGSYEFPGDDAPTTVEGKVILQKFSLLAEGATVEAKPSSEVREIEVTAKQWEFSPNPIEVNKDEKVRLKITSIDVAHGFALPEFGISERLNPGNTVTVEFTPDKTGSFTFFCNVFCGSGHGRMRGTLVVK